MNGARISVLVIDDDPDVATMLAVLVNRQGDMACTGTLDSADRLVESLEAAAPDVALLDLSMPGSSPLVQMTEATRRFPGTRFIMLSGYGDGTRVEQALKAGASGFVSKDQEVEEILKAIRAVAAGQRYVKAGG